jgi:hypothetical protein
VVLLDRGLVANEIFIVIREVDMKKPNGYFGQIPKGLEWRCKTGQNPLFRGHFLGIFEIFRGGKGTPDHKYGKIYLLNILPPQQSKQLCLTKVFPVFLHLGDNIFAKNSKSRENVKRTKLTIPY